MTITIRGADGALARIRRLAGELPRRRDAFLDRLAEVGINSAAAGFASARYDGVNDVAVSGPDRTGPGSVRIHADGQAVAFIEFGAGVHYASGHPEAARFGAFPGSYGYGLGKNDSWRYKGDPGTDGVIIASGRHAGEVLTHGNPPARAMYEAGKTMRRSITETAREAFG